MLLSIEGDESTGKTTLAYTAPPQVVGFSFDMGAERAIYGTKYEEHFADKTIRIVPYSDTPKALWQDYDITVYELPPPIQLDAVRVHGAKKLWSYFLTLIAQAIADPNVRSIVVDTMSVARRVKADAYLESLQEEAKSDEDMRKQLLQIEWGIANSAIRDIYTTCAGVKKNLIAVHHLTEERIDMVGRDGQVVQGVLTGKRILEGLAQTYRFVDVAIRMEKQSASLTAEFRKCGYNLSLEGTKLPNPTWSSLTALISDSLGGRLSL